MRRGAALLSLALASCASAADPKAFDNARRLTPAAAPQEQLQMLMTVGAQRFTVTLDDSPTTRALVQLLPTTLEMSELNGNEKHGRLPRSLPTSAVRPGIIRTGDVLLYGSDTLVVFYDTFQSSYSYTPIGRIQESAGLARALGPGNPRITLTLP